MRLQRLVDAALWLGAAASGAASPDAVTEHGGVGIVRAAADPVDRTSGALLAARLTTGVAQGAVLLVLPVAGDPGGAWGPPELLPPATLAGGAVLVLAAGAALMPVDDDGAWVLHPYAGPPSTWPAPDAAEASRGLRRAMRETADRLEVLDLAGGRAAYDATSGRQERRSLPPDVTGERLALLDLALRVHTALEVAATAPGGATSASGAAARLDALADLRRCVRRAIEAAASTTGTAPAH